MRMGKLFQLSWNVPYYPNEEHWCRKDLPDIGTNTEVRSVRTNNAIPFWEKDLEKILVATKCLDLEKFSQVFVFGYALPGVYQSDEYFDESIAGWRIPLDDFHFEV